MRVEFLGIGLVGIGALIFALFLTGRVLKKDPGSKEMQEIAKAIEELFKVQVEKVNTLHVQGKLRRQGKFEGYTASWKKAIVTLTEDSKTIEFFDGMV